MQRGKTGNVTLEEVINSVLFPPKRSNWWVWGFLLCLVFQATSMFLKI